MSIEPESGGGGPAETGVRRRTRRALVDAAIGAWARDWGASLADIADAAAVSRSTLHRYFTDRQALVDAARDRATEALEESAVAATVGCTTPIEELSALMRAMIDVGDAVIFLFSDPNRFAEFGSEGPDDEHAELRALVVSAQETREVAGDVDPEWVINVFYSLIYVAAEAINAGTLPRHRAGDVSVRTFMRGVATEL